MRTLLNLLKVVGLGLLSLSCTRRPDFPFHDLKVSDGDLHTSLSFNPYSDLPPQPRWEIAVGFLEILLPGAEEADRTFISYTVDFGVNDWRKLAGTYRLNSTSGSDLWINGNNYGYVDLNSVTIVPKEGARLEMTLDLTFNFDGGAFKRERRLIGFETEYDGLHFRAPIWNEPDDVSFPESWNVPTTSTHWSDEEVRSFVGEHIDLGQFGEIKIDHSGSSTDFRALP